MPSYFSLELEQPEVGRVLRFDSLSKVLSAGIRIGFLCGPEPLMALIDMHVRFLLLEDSEHSLTHYPDRRRKPSDPIAHPVDHIRHPQLMGL